ncbi:MAG TPA: MarR family transcriptional regulator [Anaerolineales bacterium]|nr:MarR family transcriptional regulator [Anaerolineales bacterium]
MNELSSLERKTWGNFIVAWATINRIVEDDLQANGQITHVEYEITLRLYRAEGRKMRIQELGKQSLLTRSGTSRAVARLEQLGLVRRETAPEDRRGSYAVLTDAGQELFEKLMPPHLLCVREHFLRHFSTDELTQLAEFLGRLTDKNCKPR